MNASQTAVSPRAALETEIHRNQAVITSYLRDRSQAERFMALASRAVIDNPDLWECSSASVLRALGAAAASGLPIDGKMSSLVVRKSKHGKPTANWDPSYRGMCYLALESGHVRAVEAHAVHQRDEFHVELGTSAAIHHRPYLVGDRGPVVAAYAIAVLRDGGVVREVLGAGDLQKIRAASPAADSGPWKSWPDRMSMKSAMRRLLKRLPAADIGALERARQHVLEQDDGEGGAYQATLEQPTRSTSSPADTAALEARAIEAISQAGDSEGLAATWSGIRAEFRAAGADIPIAIEARWHERREALEAA